MFKRLPTSILVLLVLLAGLVSPGHALERRVALVIGNASYRDAPLSNPPNDARDMAAALRRNGFEVIELIDGTQKEMNRAIAKFGERLTIDSVALFYYAGHGMQVRGKNYLIPIDAQISNETSIRVESVDVDGVLDQLGSSELNVVILDACRNNPFERRFRSLGGGLAQMDAPKGSLIAYATAPGKTAVDGDGRNGLFTQELLKQMQIPGLTIEQVFKNVRREVARVTRDNQIPWESSSLTGDFYFIPSGRSSLASPLPARPAAPPVAPPAAVVAKAPEKEVEARQAVSPAATPVAKEAPPVATRPDPAPIKPEVSEPPKEQVFKTDSFTASGRLVVDNVTGAMTGEGTIQWVNGDRYEGAMVSGKKQGKGVFTWRDGQRYDGEWANDMINGRGILHYTNGDRYEGDFVNGEPHGTGTYTLQNGDVYTGAWAHGNKHGHGRLSWASGDYWEGEFRDDRQTDNGRLVYGDAADAPAEASVQKPAAAAKSPAKPVAAKKSK